MRKILIIDDCEDILFAISEFFKFKNWDVFTAENIEQGLKIIKEQAIDIVIIDYQMPEINGVMGVKLIRLLDLYVPIIAMTIADDQKIADEFFKAGVNDFAIKPIKMLDLYSRVNVHLKNQNYKDLQSSLRPREHQKGITEDTIILIEEKLRGIKEYLTIESISLKTGLAPQTVNKYMNYLIDKEDIKMEIIYGQRGRPKKRYCFKETE